MLLAILVNLTPLFAQKPRARAKGKSQTVANSIRQLLAPLAEDTLTGHWRPRYHFTPPYGRMWQPVTLIEVNGVHHYYYRWQLEGKGMVWGHATSTDLLSWQHQLPIQLATAGDSMANGCIMLPPNQTPAKAATLWAYYQTKGLGGLSGIQLAQSTDGGYSFQPVANGLMFSIADTGLVSPWVFQQGKYWQMATILPQVHKVRFFKSEDLKTWTHTRDFGPEGDLKMPWDKPQVFTITKPGTDTTKWVLMHSAGNRLQYFLGHFEKFRFYSEYSSEYSLRLETGPDLVYGVVGSGSSQAESRPFLGWLAPAGGHAILPTRTWQGSVLTMPREIKLDRTFKGLRLLQQPMPAVQQLFFKVENYPQVPIYKLNDALKRIPPPVGKPLFIELGMTQNQGIVFGLKFLKKGPAETSIGFDIERNAFFIDRSNAGANPVNASEFAKLKRGGGQLKEEKLNLRIFSDGCVVEAYDATGETVMGALVFPPNRANGLELFNAGGGDASMMHLRVYALK